MAVVLPVSAETESSSQRASLASSFFKCSDTDENIYQSVLEVHYPSDEWATMVLNCLSVDSELQPDKLRREISVQGTKLRVGFATSDLRLLRAAFNAFMDMLILATKTLEQFGTS